MEAFTVVPPASVQRIPFLLRAMSPPMWDSDEPTARRRAPPCPAPEGGRDDQSLSELVNAAVRRTLGEDAEDLAAFEARAKEPNLPFEGVLKDLRRRGKL